MAKITFSNLSSLQNETAAINTINANFGLLATFIDTLLSRDGTSPNTLTANLDMNSRHIQNLPAAAGPTEPVRKAEFDAATGSSSSADADAAAASALAAANSASAAHVSEVNAAASAAAVGSFDPANYVQKNGTGSPYTGAIAFSNGITVSGATATFLSATFATNYTITLTASNPRFTYDSTDYYEYDRASNFHKWVIAGNTVAQFAADAFSGDIKANSNDFWAGTTGQIITTDSVWLAASPKPVSYASTITLDLATGGDFDISALTGNLTLANPTNAKPGQKGVIYLPQDGTGGRTLTLGSNFKKANGADVTLSLGAGKVDMLSYSVRAVNFIVVGLIKDLS